MNKWSQEGIIEVKRFALKTKPDLINGIPLDPLSPVRRDS